jgi:hypothetical protein
VVEEGAGMSQRCRVHALDEAVDRFALGGAEPGDDPLVGVHEGHEPVPEQSGDQPVGDVPVHDVQQRPALPLGQPGLF